MMIISEDTCLLSPISSILEIEDLQLTTYSSALEKLQAASQLGLPVFLDLAYLPKSTNYLTALTLLHTLSGLPVVLLGTPEQAAELPDHVFDHVGAFLRLPLCRQELLLYHKRWLNDQQALQEQAAYTQRLNQLISENRGLAQRLKQLELYEPETGLFNRRALDARLSEEWRRAHRNAHPLSILMLRTSSDMPADARLALAHLLKAVRVSDCVAAYDTQTFVLILPMTFKEGAQALMAHFRGRIEALWEKYELEGAYQLRALTEIPQCHAEAQAFLSRLISPRPSALVALAKG